MSCFWVAKNKNIKFFSLMLLVVMCFTKAFSQETSTIQDSLVTTPSDSIALFRDTIAHSPDSVKSKKSAIDAVVTYQASDSIVLFSNGKGFLYGKGTVNYQEIELIADYIEIDMDSAQVYASGVPDTLGDLQGNPIFKEGSDSYESRTIKYNFNTKKGYINHVVTQQGEGYVVSERTKKTADDMLYMRDGRYTTCSDHDHPHFYLNLTKAKVKPKSFIVTGPAYLVMEDVPLPLAIPFGYFPFTDSYSSGVLMPSYGDEMTRGFFLRDGGYYFAISDYFDFALTGDIYTKGSWALKGASSYVKRYKFRGSLSASYMVSVLGEKEVSDYQKNKDFSLNWTHSQDAKANIYRTLSASVSFVTSSYNRNSVNSYYDPGSLSQSTRSSTISLTQRFPNSPFSVSANMSVNQRTRDSTINMTLPNVTVNMSRIYPFKRKNAVGKERWYEKISVAYTGSFSNSLPEMKEDQVMKSSFKKDWKKDVKHTISPSMSFTVLKYLTVTPSINYNERWLFSSVEKAWDYENNREIVTDTLYKFKRIYEYNFGLNLTTKLYGFFRPLPAFGGNKINMIRWVITPSVGFSATPDFGAEKYGYWNTYTRVYDDNTQALVYYSPYSYSSSRGEQGNINFSLGNNLEMKVKSKRDSIGTKKISLIDNFSVSGSYNLVADSMNLSNLNANLRLKFSDKFGINLSGQFDPYEYKLNKDNKPVRSREYRWDHGRMPQLISTSTSFGYAFSNQTFKKKNKETGNTETEESDDLLGDELATAEPESLLSSKKKQKEMTSDGYAKFTMPWNLRFDYSLRYARDTFNERKMQYNLKFTHNVSFSGDLALTEKWRFNFNASYDITNDEVTYTSCGITRDLHCWSLTGSFVPIGLYKSYNITIRVKSSLLQDLKYEQRSNSSEGVW